MKIKTLILTALLLSANAEGLQTSATAKIAKEARHLKEEVEKGQAALRLTLDVAACKAYIQEKDRLYREIFGSHYALYRFAEERPISFHVLFLGVIPSATILITDIAIRLLKAPMLALFPLATFVACSAIVIYMLYNPYNSHVVHGLSAKEFISTSLKNSQSRFKADYALSRA